ncbi:7-carboxy-7-deazaguanine synthase [Fretibacter rubidus]|uniref:7-carboxy-7-deazaguanine synthase n=1 Tax=Fretibacter rubidus TaxID=570162 RepID=UPI00352B4004
MVYSVKEIYLTIQGEGGQTGLPAIFLRFAGCNLWSGLERDRADAVCNFCDTDFVGVDGPGGGKFKTPQDLVAALENHWPAGQPNKWIVATGGEPLLQLDAPLIDALHAAGFKIAVESNGTVIAPDGIDWLCISPKAGAEVVQISGHELKLVYPQIENTPDDFAHMDFARFSLQPRDDSLFRPEQNATNVKACVEYCLTHPQWCLSIQTHKMIGID